MSTAKTLMPPPLPTPIPGPDVQDATYANSRLGDWELRPAALAVKPAPTSATKSRREIWLCITRRFWHGIRNAASFMTALRYLIVCLLLSGRVASPAYAQRLKINYVFLPERPVVAAKLHPAVKGALIGGAAGAG